MNPQIIIHDAITGETVSREMSDAELQSFIEPKTFDMPIIDIES